MQRGLVLVSIYGVVNMGCSKSGEVTCGPGTKLVDGVCTIGPPVPVVAASSRVASPPVSASAAVGSPPSTVPAAVVSQVPRTAAASDRGQVAAGGADPWTKNQVKVAIEETKWFFWNDRDEMRNAYVQYARRVSSNQVEFTFPYAGGAHLQLGLRRGSKGSGVGLDAMLVIKPGQFECGWNGCAITMKFDDGPVERWRMTEAQSNNGMIFFDRPRELIARLNKASRVMIEASFFSEGRRQFTLEVSPVVWPAIEGQSDARR